MEASERLKAALLHEQSLGFFTDFYVEAGRLDKPEASYSFGNASALFDLASLTKALVTAPLTHQYLRRHGIDWAAPLDRWAPGTWQAAFAPCFTALSAQSLLAHRSGLPAWRNFWMGHLHAGPALRPHIKNAIIPHTFARMKAPEGAADLYSDLGYILLGYALEAASDQRLDQLWEAFLKPFAIDARALGFTAPPASKAEDFVPSAYCALRERLLQGEVHDENCAALGGMAGHAGLFGRGPTLGTFLRKLSQSNEGLAYLEANQRALSEHAFEGLSGLRRGAGPSAQLFAGGRGMGHLGFTGTAFWLDLSSQRYAIFLSNRVISARINPHITAVRRQVFGLLHELC